MLRSHVSDLTVDELKALVRETVEETLAEFLTDPDKGLALRESMKTALEESTKMVREGGAVYMVNDVARTIEDQSKQDAEITFHAIIKNGIIELPRGYKVKANQRVRVIITPENKGASGDTAIDRLLARPLRIKNFQPFPRNEIYAR